MRRSIGIRRYTPMLRVCSIVFSRFPSSMSVMLIYIRRYTLIIILTLRRPVLEFEYVTASSFLPTTIVSRVLTPRRSNCVMKVMCSYCDTFAISDTLYRYKLILSQVSTNGFMSPWTSESVLSHAQWVHNGSTIVVNDRSCNLTMLHWSEIYSFLRVGWFATSRVETMPRHSGHMNPK